MKRRKPGRGGNQGSPFGKPNPCVTESIPGMGASDPEQLKFSPTLLTPQNVGTVLHYVARAVGSAIDSLKVVATSAVQAFIRYELKCVEANAELNRQAATWMKLVRGPLEAEVDAMQGERRHLTGAEHLLRSDAAKCAALEGLDFSMSDLDSVEDCQDMIERNGSTDDEDRGRSESANQKAPVSWWLQAISTLSPLLLTLLTAIGLLKLLSGTDVQSAISSPMFPIALALALGVSVPTLIGAYRFGWLIATSRAAAPTAMPSLASRYGVVIGGLAVGLTAAFVAGIDALGVQALSMDMMRGLARQGASSQIGPWLQVIGFAFMGAATISKIWAGYCDAVEAFQADQIAGRRRDKVQGIRYKAAKVVSRVAEADAAAERLAELESKLEEALALLEDTKFTPEFSKELLEETKVEKDAWIGECGRFWAMVWDVIPDSTVRRVRVAKPPTKLKSFWDRVLGRRR